MLRLERTKGKAFLWDLRASAESVRLLISGLSRLLYSVQPSELGKAEKEIFSRNRIWLQNEVTANKKRLSTAPEHKYRQQDSIVRRLSLSNLFKRKDDDDEPSAVAAVAYPWASNYAREVVAAHRTRPQAARQSAIVRLRDRVLETTYQIGKRINSCEFWLGFGFGLLTRMSTRALVLDAFPSLPEYATAISIFASAVAGISAGIAACLARSVYRNAHRAPNSPKELYFSRRLFESALIGLFGGIFGGCATNFGTLLARSSAFAVGTVSGAAASLFQAFMRNGWRGRDGSIGWERFAFQSAVYGLAGGVLGIVSGDLLGSSHSIAASVPVGGADSVLYINARPTGPEFCGTDQCWAPPPPPVPELPPQPLIPAGPPPPAEEIIRITVPEHGHRLPMHHPKTLCAPKQPVVPKKEAICYPAKHVKHVRHLKHLKHLKEPTEIIIHRTIIPGVLSPPPEGIPMHTFAPIVPPPMAEPPLQGMPPPPERFFNPCETGMCGDEPCYDSSAINVKGPCSDPNIPCVERVSFNSDGEATKVVLEPADRRISKAYYELRQNPEDMRMTNWNTAQQGDFISAHAGNRSEDYSLVVPVLNNRTLALGSFSPMPA